MLEEKLKNFTKDLEDCKSKLGAISELEKKIKKKFNEVSENSDVLK